MNTILDFDFIKSIGIKDSQLKPQKKCFDFGFDEFKIEKIVGRAMKENFVSIKVLEKISMTFKESFDFEEHEGVIYELTNKGNENRSLNR